MLSYQEGCSREMIVRCDWVDFVHKPRRRLRDSVWIRSFDEAFFSGLLPAFCIAYSRRNNNIGNSSWGEGRGGGVIKCG